MKKNIFILLIFINSFVVLGNKPLFAKCFFQNCHTSKKESANFLATISEKNYLLDDQFKNILIKEDIELKEIFDFGYKNNSPSF